MLRVESGALRIGDIITLQNISSSSFLSAEGILLDDIYVSDDLSKFEDTLFQVHLQRQYSASRDLLAFLSTYGGDEKKIEDETWLFNGGKATFRSYDSKSEVDKLNHLAFFQRMLNYFIDDENRLFIHAGFSSLHGPYKEHYSSNYSWDRTLWEMALCMDKRIKKESVLYPKRLKLFSEIYIGHSLPSGCATTAGWQRRRSEEI
jgi:hypothetical protein